MLKVLLPIFLSGCAIQQSGSTAISKHDLDGYRPVYAINHFNDELGQSQKLT